MEEELIREIPEMNLERKLRAADRRSIADALPADSVLVEIVRCNIFDFKAVPARGDPAWTPARYVAFVLQADVPDRVRMVDLGPARSIDRMVDAFRRSIGSGAGGRNLIPSPAPAEEKPRVGTDLRAAVFDPLVALLNGSTRLFLAPDGDLTLLPFEVLPASDGRFLIDDYLISYLSVGRDALRFGAPSYTRAGKSLVIADPDFDLGGTIIPIARCEREDRGRLSRDMNRGSLVFPRLPDTKEEGERIAEMLGVEPWLSGSALDGSLKSYLRDHPSPPILHFATDGFFLEDQKFDHQEKEGGLEEFGGVSHRIFGRLSNAMENPLLRSGLVLAGANTWLQGKPLPNEAEDGILTAEDVSGVDLSGTDLVVLSACETGLGEVRAGEGVFGLRRAFMLAGAKTLVMSLWKITDQQTRELMEDFYRRILNGEPRAQALRNAQLTIKRTYHDPYYWGAFICQGDPGPLPSSGEKQELSGKNRNGAA